MFRIYLLLLVTGFVFILFPHFIRSDLETEIFQEWIIWVKEKNMYLKMSQTQNSWP